MSSLRSITTALAAALVLAGFGASSALADQRTKALERPTIVRVDDRSDFDWADAGIGAAGGVALSVLGLGVVLLVSARSRPST